MNVSSVSVAQAQPINRTSLVISQARNTQPAAIPVAQAPINLFMFDDVQRGCRVENCCDEDWFIPTVFTDTICIRPANDQSVCIGCGDDNDQCNDCYNEVYASCSWRQAYPWLLNQ